MRTTTLTLSLALLATAPWLLAPSAEADDTRGLDAVVVRDHCFTDQRQERQHGAYGGLGSSYGSGGGSSTSSGVATRSARKSMPAPTAQAPAPPPAPAREAVADQAQAPGYVGGERNDDADGIAMDELEAEEAFASGRDAPGPVQRRQGPRVDWGGVVHLSNDDSMSLASAQRLLYALDRGVRFTLDQVRPHELLNYFTFDTAAPGPRETFGVHASAERHGDTLALALAVKGATPTRPDVDLTLLVDRSGSMRAEGRMEYTKRALRLATDQLRRGDRVDLVLFDTNVCTPLENFVVGRDDPALLRGAIERMQPRSSTNLNAGLHEAYRVATGHAASASRAQRVMLFTDAMLNTGDVNPHTVSEIGRALDKHDIHLTGVGVGREFRDDVLDKLTEKGKGAYVFLGSERVVDRLFGSGFDALLQTIALDVRFALDLPDGLGMKRFYGEEMSTNAADIQPVSYHAGNSQVFLQDLAIRDGWLREHERIAMTVSWDDPTSGRRQSQTFERSVHDALAADPHNVRKASALMAWSDVLTAHAMGADACGESFDRYRRQLPGLRGDAEIAYVSELVGKWCDLSAPIAAWTAPAHTRVRLDADQAITEVALTCGNGTQRKTLSLSDTVASFDATPGTCDLTLYGTVPMTTRVEIPATGADMRCVVRAGRMSCTI